MAHLRRLLKPGRVGHAGTLDPLATGVLPVGLGQGTRVLEYLAGSSKSYRAKICLGITTDTYDSEGRVTAKASIDALTRPDIERAAARFQGWIEQRPPVYSALKRDGRPLYAYARAGEAVEALPRPVRIDSLAILHFEPPELEVQIECGTGFYVRSLAFDLGEVLECGAHLTELLRTRVGPFRLHDAVSLSVVEGAASAGSISQLLRALDTPLQDKPALILAESSCADLVNGKRIPIALSPPWRVPLFCRAYSTGGELVAVGQIGADACLQPLKVFPPGHRGPNLEQGPSDRIIDENGTRILG